MNRKIKGRGHKLLLLFTMTISLIFGNALMTSASANDTTTTSNQETSIPEPPACTWSVEVFQGSRKAMVQFFDESNTIKTEAATNKTCSSCTTSNCSNPCGIKSVKGKACSAKCCAKETVTKKTPKFTSKQVMNNGSLQVNIFDNHIGFIRINNMIDPYLINYFDNAMGQLGGCNKIILDLRGSNVRDNSNRGFENCLQIAAELVNQGELLAAHFPRQNETDIVSRDYNQIVTDIYANNQYYGRRQRNAAPYRLGNRELVVLHDQNTLCSAELLAHAIQANVYCYEIGTDTYGNTYTPATMDGPYGRGTNSQVDMYRRYYNDNRYYITGSYQNRGGWRLRPQEWIQLNGGARYGDINSDNQMQRAVQYCRGYGNGPGGPGGPNNPNGPGRGGPNNCPPNSQCGPNGPNNGPYGPNGPNNGPHSPNNNPRR